MKNMVEVDGSQIELEDCPFCGHEADISYTVGENNLVEDFVVECTKCGARGKLCGDEWDSQSKAVKAWNRRV